jgi:hypothetical protein
MKWKLFVCILIFTRYLSWFLSLRDILPYDFFALTTMSWIISFAITLIWSLITIFRFTKSKLFTLICLLLFLEPYFMFLHSIIKEGLFYD